MLIIVWRKFTSRTDVSGVARDGWPGVAGQEWQSIPWCL